MSTSRSTLNILEVIRQSVIDFCDSVDRSDSMCLANVSILTNEICSDLLLFHHLLSLSKTFSI